jgi:cysteine desulfuration protein SufE
METTCLDKQDKIMLLFADCATQEAKYKKIIELGSSLPLFNPLWKIQENLVRGCQSITYLRCTYSEGVIRLYAHSDALISAGLAALLVLAFDGETPEAILRSPPEFVQKLQLNSLLSPSRSNGLAGMYTRIRTFALEWAIKNRSKI